MAGRDLFADDQVEPQATGGRDLFAEPRQPFQPEPFTVNPDYAGVNPITGNLEQLASGATLGFSDELQAGIGAATSYLTPEGRALDMPFAERYRSIRDPIRQQRRQFIEQEGAAAYAPELLGGLMTGGSGLARAGSGLLPKTAVGIAEGATAGVGATDAPLLSMDTGQNMLIGGGLGLAGGLLVPPLLRGGAAAGRGLLNLPARMMPNAGGRPARYAEQLTTGLDDDLAPYMMRGDRLAPDPLYREASRQGIPDGTINMIKSASPDDRAAAQEMLSIIRRNRGNALLARTQRPGDVAGRTLERYIRYVDDVNRQSRIALNNYAKNNLAGQQVNIDDSLRQFADTLDDMGIGLRETASGKIVPDFDAALLPRADRGPITEVVKHVVNLMEQGRPDAYQAHRLKRAIDNNLVYDGKNPLTADTTNLLRGLRRQIDQSLDATFPQYDQINQQVAETTGALIDFQKAAGSSYIPESDNFGKQLGTLGRRLMSNTTNRIRLEDAIKRIEDTARNQGAEFTDSSVMQAYLVDDLEEMFGESAQTGIRSIIGRGILDAARQGASGQRTPTGALSEAGASVMEHTFDVARGINEESAFNILEQMLTR